MTLAVCATIDKKEGLLEYVDNLYNIGVSKVYLFNINNYYDVENILYAYIGINFVEVFSTIAVNMTELDCYEYIQTNKSYQYSWTLYTAVSNQLVPDITDINEFLIQPNLLDYDIITIDIKHRLINFATAHIIRGGLDIWNWINRIDESKYKVIDICTLTNTPYYLKKIL